MVGELLPEGLKHELTSALPSKPARSIRGPAFLLPGVGPRHLHNDTRETLPKPHDYGVSSISKRNEI